MKHVRCKCGWCCAEHHAPAPPPQTNPPQCPAKWLPSDSAVPMSGRFTHYACNAKIDKWTTCRGGKRLKNRPESLAKACSCAVFSFTTFSIVMGKGGHHVCCMAHCTLNTPQYMTRSDQIVVSHWSQPCNQGPVAFVCAFVAVEQHIHSRIMQKPYLPMPPGCNDSSVPAASVSARFGSLSPRKTQPNPTAKNLWEQVHFSPKRSDSDLDTPSPKPAPNPASYTPDKQAADPTPYLQESAQSRPLPHTASWYTLHSRSKGFCILALCPFPGMFHPTLATPPPCSRVPVYCANGLQTVCPNPHATPAMGHGARPNVQSGARGQ